MSRIPYPPLDTLPKIKHDWIFDPTRKYLLNVTKMTLHIPEGLWQHHAQFARAMITKTTLDKRHKEILICRVGWLEKSEYEMHHHRSIALNVGVTPEQLAALQSEDVSIFTGAERALVDFVTELVRNVSPSDATLAAMREHFSDGLMFEAIAIVGYYMMTARIIAVGGVDLDEAPVTPW
jgi:alkylhydroperoxidase family enzyme